jgi:DNA-binding Xre family transcriptional regulator
MRSLNVNPLPLAKLRNGENVNASIPVRISQTLSCKHGNIIELSSDEKYIQAQKTR